MNVREIADFSEKLWFEKRGLAATVAVATIGLFPLLLTPMGLGGAIAGTVTAYLALFALWWWTRQPPKAPANKIGFVVSISYSDDNEGKKLQEDFIRPLRELVKSGKAGKAFHVMEMPQHIATTIQDQDQAVALRIKCRAHFMIYGRVRLREINGKEVHVLDLEGLVAHTPVPDQIASLFAQEFTELMPRKLHVAKENDLLSFQFTSEWTDLVARYIIGLASAISGDWDYAETLLQEVKARLHGKSTDFPVYLKLKERVPLRISELYQARALTAYNKWVETKDDSFLRQSEAHLANLAPAHRDSKEALNLKAILAFVLQRDIDEAIALIKRVKTPQHSQWHLNIAFLLGYDGQLKNAIRHYRLAAKIETSPETLSQIEDFIVWVLQVEPERSQLYYCLGFFNWRIKGDLMRAAQDFESFLASPVLPGSEKERELAKKWLDEISIALNPSTTIAT